MSDKQKNVVMIIIMSLINIQKKRTTESYRLSNMMPINDYAKTQRAWEEVEWFHINNYDSSTKAISSWKTMKTSFLSYNTL